MAARPSARAGAQPGRMVVISTLGLGQILAWGSSYYLLAVLAPPIAADTGWPLPWIVTGLSIGSLTAGVIAPRVGHAIQTHGGRLVMATGTVLLALGLLGLSLAPSLPLHLLAWAVIGGGMGCSLYDAAFSTLGRLYGQETRRAITTLTLFGGFRRHGPARYRAPLSKPRRSCAAQERHQPLQRGRLHGRAGP